MNPDAHCSEHGCSRWRCTEDHPEASVLLTRRLSPPAHVSDLMFRDTVTARMLRKLCSIGRMTQAQFMAEYHKRCERPERSCFTCCGNGTVGGVAQWLGGPTNARECDRCGGTGVGRTSRSSFVDNFGRFVVGSPWGAHSERMSGRVFPTVIKPYACITQALPASPSRSHRHDLVWSAEDPTRLVHTLRDARLHAAFTEIERQLTSPRATDDETETASWMLRIREEITRRTR